MAHSIARPIFALALAGCGASYFPPHDGGLDAAHASDASSGKDGATAGTEQVSGTISGVSPAIADVAFTPDPTCGAGGILIALTGQSLAGCAGAGSLPSRLVKPYLQIHLAAPAPGPYYSLGEAHCGDPGQSGFFATFDGQTGGSDEALSGMVTIAAADATHVQGSFTILFADSGGSEVGTLQGSFDAPPCPR